MRNRTTARRRPSFPVLRGTLVMGAVVLAAWFGPAIASASAATHTITISGGPTGIMYPGSTLPLDLEFTNPNSTRLRLTSLHVAVASVLPGTQGTCTAADFAVDNGSVDAVVLPAGGDKLLSDLVDGPVALPSIRMLDTAANQDGCKNAEVSLTYTVTATDVDGTTSADSGSDHGDADGTHLPHTGADHSTWGLLLIGLALAAAGTTTIVITRRRGERS